MLFDATSEPHFVYLQLYLAGIATFSGIKQQKNKSRFIHLAFIRKLHSRYKTFLLGEITGTTELC